MQETRSPSGGLIPDERQSAGTPFLSVAAAAAGLASCAFSALLVTIPLALPFLLAAFILALAARAKHHRGGSAFFLSAVALAILTAWGLTLLGVYLLDPGLRLQTAKLHWPV